MESRPTFEFERLSGCPLCGCDSSNLVLERKVRGLPLRFVKCADCRLIHQNPRLTQAALQQFFSSTFFIQDSKTSDCNLNELLGYFDYMAWDASYRRSAFFRLQRILKYKRTPASLLEIGSSTGSFLEEAQKVGFQVQSLDVSSKFASMARGRGFQVDEGFVESFALPPKQFDIVCCFGGITCWFDPVAGFKNVRQCLKEDGIFVFNHMDADNFFYRIQGFRNWDYQHTCLTLWSDATMHRCLGMSGFEPVFAQSERQFVSLGRLFEYLKLPILRRLAASLNIMELGLPVVVPFTKFVICKAASNGR